MKKSFAAKRIPRKIAQDEDGEEHITPASLPASEVVKRPPLPTKSKKRSSLRLSFGPGEREVDGGDTEGSPSVFTPKKSSLSRLALDRNAERKSLPSTLSSELRQVRSGVLQDQPSYSKDYLDELRNSTPSTPQNLKPTSTDESNNAIDIASKFGPLAKLVDDGESIIPSQAEVREKKERRARLAKEQASFISLEDENEDDQLSDGSNVAKEISLRPKEKYSESRLVREDEDIAEGFDDFVEDGKISLGRKAEREAEKQRRAEMAHLIDEAEGAGSDDGSDDSEAERKAAYEAAQTRAGIYGHRETQELKTPPRITPLPNLDAVVARLQAALKSMEDIQARKIKRMESLRSEKADIAERENWVQGQLKETGERYEKRRVEAGLCGAPSTPVNGSEGTKLIIGRGLESLGATPIAAISDTSDG